MNLNNVLIVDKDSHEVSIIEKFLTNIGYFVIKTESATSGIEILKKNPVQVVITDLNLPGINGIEFLLWIKKHSPESRVIMVTDLISSEIKEFVNKNGALMYFEKPVNLDLLKQAVSSGFSNRGFTGDITDIRIYDFIQMMLLAKKQLIISITDIFSNKPGKLYLKDGDIIHAEFGNLKGLEAFSAVIGLKNGRFTNEAWSEPSERTINQTPLHLLIEAVKIIEDKQTNLSEITEKGSTELTGFALKNLENINHILGMAEQNSTFTENENTSSVKRILFVDDEKSVTNLAKNYFISEGFYLDTASTVKEGAEILKKENFDFVVTDIDMPEVNGFEFLLWIKETRPQCKVIMMTAFGSDEMEEFAGQKGAIKYFEKPLNLKELKNVITDISNNSGLTGNIVDINLFDFVQLIILSKQEKLILIKDPVTRQKGRLFLKEGNIIHAECGNLKGEIAFYSIMAMKSGQFSEEEWLEPDTKTINNKPMRLFLEASRRIDEQNNRIINLETVTKSLNREAEIQEGPKALQRYEFKLPEKNLNFTIHETGSAFGIIIGKTGKSEVIEIMKNYSSIDYSKKLNDQIFIYDEISFSVFFDETGLVKELNFGRAWPGVTSKGVYIGATIEDAVKAYGTPRFSSKKGVIWNKIAIFCQDTDLITSIRLSAD